MRQAWNLHHCRGVCLDKDAGWFTGWRSLKCAALVRGRFWEGEKGKGVSCVRPDHCSLRRSRISALSLGWCGEWRVSGIVTGSSNASRQLQHEATQPLQRCRCTSEISLSVYINHIYCSNFAPAKSHKCARACVSCVRRRGTLEHE